MKAFDFDNTLYRGESVFDFALFMIKKKKKFLFYIPSFVKLLIFYKSTKISIEKFTKSLEKYSQIFLKNKEEIFSYVDEFWEKNIDKIYPEMLEKVKENDVIITASPSFLIERIQNILPTKNILATKLDLDKGKIIYLNFQSNKVEHFKKIYPHATIEEFYTDSMNDLAMMNISKNVYLVKKGVSTKIK